VILADVNVLIASFREDSEFHPICRPWLDRVVSSRAPFGVSRLALAAVVRITTAPRPFDPPSSLEDAFGFCSDLLDQAHCVAIDPGDRHWSIFSRLCVETRTRSKKVTDAWYAALAIEHGCTWITFDRDYGRFPGLDWREPS
jgi:hypothetical protein